MFKENDKVTINTPLEPVYHNRTGTVTRVQAGFSHVQVDGLTGVPYRFSDRELALTQSDWSEVLDGLSVDQLRSLADAAFGRAVDMLTDVRSDNGLQ